MTNTSVTSDQYDFRRILEIAERGCLFVDQEHINTDGLESCARSLGASVRRVRVEPDDTDSTISLRMISDLLVDPPDWLLKSTTTLLDIEEEWEDFFSNIDTNELLIIIDQTKASTWEYSGILCAGLCNLQYMCQRAYGHCGGHGVTSTNRLMVVWVTERAFGPFTLMPAGDFGGGLVVSRLRLADFRPFRWTHEDPKGQQND